MTLRDGTICVGLCCSQSHHWSAFTEYNATTDRLLLVSWPDAFCPTCGRPDSELGQAVDCCDGKRLSLCRGWKMLEGHKPSLLSRFRAWLWNFTGVDPVVLGYMLGVMGLLLLVGCRLIACWMKV